MSSEGKTKCELTRRVGREHVNSPLEFSLRNDEISSIWVTAIVSGVSTSGKICLQIFAIFQRFEPTQIWSAPSKTWNLRTHLRYAHHNWWSLQKARYPYFQNMKVLVPPAPILQNRYSTVRPTTSVKDQQYFFTSTKFWLLWSLNLPFYSELGLHSPTWLEKTL